MIKSKKVERKLYKGVGKFKPLNLGNFIPLLTSIYDYGTAYLLHPKDALHLAVMKRYRIFDIATNDGDFERVDWIKVWSP